MSPISLINYPLPPRTYIHAVQSPTSLQSSGNVELCHANTGQVVTSHAKLGTMYPRIKLPKAEHGQVYVCLDKSKLKKVMQMKSLSHC